MLNTIPRKQSPTICWLLVAAIAGNVLWILVMASVPPVSRDALAHHLAVPKLYLEQGGLVELSHIPFSYYPMNVDLLYLLPLYWGHDIAAKYIHFAFALLTGWLIYRFLRPTAGKRYALLGVLCFLSLPVIVKLSITAYADLGLIFFSTAALIQILKWAASGFQWPPLIFSAIFCGLAAGTKYNGLITLCLLTLFVPFIYMRVKRNAGAQWPAVGYGTVYLLVALLLFSPWMIRNTLWTGNPVYPLYQSLLAPAEQTSAKGAARQGVPRHENALNMTANREAPQPLAPLRHFAYRHKAFGESVWEMAVIPIRIFFQGRDDSPKYFDGTLNPYLFFFPLLAFVFIKQAKTRLQFETKVLGAFAGLFLLIVFLQEDMRIRWVGPMIPPLVILTVIGLRSLLAASAGRLKDHWRPIAKTAVIAVFTGLFLFNIHYIAGLYHTVAPLDYLSGQVSRGDYISRFRPAYKLHAYAGLHLPEDATILGMFMGNRRYYSQRDILFADYLLTELVHTSASAGEMAAILRAKGITHLMLRGDLFERWRAQNFNRQETVLLRAFFQDHLTQLFTYRGYFLFKIS
jgi:4-amino-4-deoxy-L-arabinose transferase-like glycosyltransferase